MKANLLVVLALLFGRAACANGSSQWQALAPAELEVPLTNQDGQVLTFYGDLVQGKVAVINFIFTNCTQACPMLTAQFRALEKEAAAQGITDLHLVSVSVDPERDTAAALRRFASESQAGWAFLSGSEAQIKKLLGSFHLPLRQRDGHTSRFVIANGISGQWSSIDGFTDVREIIKLVQEARQQRRR